MLIGINRKAYDTVIVVGSSAVGKTHIVNSARGMPGVEVSQRYITRPCRASDKIQGADENIHTTTEDFNAMKDTILDIYWSRNLGDKVTQYGFEKQKTPGYIRILSGNNALLDYIEMNDTAFQKSLIVAVHAPDIIRPQRFIKREKNAGRNTVSLAEIAHRMEDSSDVLITRPSIDIVINNFEKHMKTSVAHFRSIIQHLIKQQN